MGLAVLLEVSGKAIWKGKWPFVVPKCNTERTGTKFVFFFRVPETKKGSDESDNVSFFLISL